jgi:hypothetical protein
LLHIWLPYAMEGLIGALLKFCYIQKHPKIIWSTQEQFLFGKTQIVGQSVGNHNIMSSSETRRKILSDNNINYSLNLNPDFKYWFIGFTEGDGSFIISVLKRSEEYSQVQVRYILSQKNEFELMTKIAVLVNGKISYLKSYNGYNMTVNLSKLHKVITYFNRYSLKTKKYINYFNW